MVEMSNVLLPMPLWLVLKACGQHACLTVAPAQAPTKMLQLCLKLGPVSTCKLEVLCAVVNNMQEAREVDAPAAIDVVFVACEPSVWVLSDVCTLLADVEAVVRLQSLAQNFLSSYFKI